MSLHSKLLSILVLMAAQAAGQQPVSVEQTKPDCLLYFVLTGAAANSGQFDNRQAGCATWTVTYTSSVYAVLNLTVQSSADNSGVPLAWGAFGGVILAGVNPNAALTQAATSLSGYYPWMRVNLAGGVGAGTIRGVLYGYKERTTQVIMGGAVGVPVFCPLRAVLTAAGAGTTQIIALTAGQSIRICHISMSLTGPSAVTLIESAKAACGAPVAVTGSYANITAMALDFGLSPLTLTAATALCVNVAAAVNAGGLVSYAIF
jgi:hypothetical protein